MEVESLDSILKGFAISDANDDAVTLLYTHIKKIGIVTVV